MEKSPSGDGLKVSTATKLGPRLKGRETRCNLNAVVQFEFNRMRSHAHAVVLFSTQGDVSIDSVVSEHATRSQELAVSVQCLQGFFQRACNLWDLFRFFWRQVIQVLSIASPGGSCS